MPIPKDKRGAYGPNWPQIRARILRRATPEGQSEPHCENCGKRDRSDVVTVWNGSGAWTYLGEERDPTNWRDRTGDWAHRPNGALRVTRVVLTVAHLNHCPEDHRDENLKALCAACHLWHDRHQHRFNRSETLRQPRHQLRMLDVERVNPYQADGTSCPSEHLI